jgi:hypothetical protein
VFTLSASHTLRGYAAPPDVDPAAAFQSVKSV